MQKNGKINNLDAEEFIRNVLKSLEVIKKNEDYKQIYLSENSKNPIEIIK